MQYEFHSSMAVRDRTTAYSWVPCPLRRRTHYGWHCPIVLAQLRILVCKRPRFISMAVSVIKLGVHHLCIELMLVRFPIAFQIVFGLIVILGVLLFPESPRWLFKHGKGDVATELMAQFHDSKPDAEEVQEDIQEIKEINAESAGRKLTWREMLSNGKEMNLWRFSAGCASQCFQQVSVRCFQLRVGPLD